MANTIKSYALDGTALRFPVTFPYLARKFVKVTLMGDSKRPLTIVTEFVFETSTTIRLLRAWGPLDGYSRVEIRRETSATDRIVSFNDATVLRAADLNASDVQALHISEEARDSVTDVFSTDPEGNLDVMNGRIVNLGDPINPGDAVNFKTLIETVGDAPGAAEAAWLAADQARAAAIRADILRVELGTSGGSEIVHIDEGLGSVGRPLSAYLADGSVNAKGFGAVGDGIHDDTDALQYCYDNFPSTYVPPGRYRTTRTLKFDRNYRAFRGSHYGQSIIEPEGAIVAVIVAKDFNSTGLVMRDVRVQCGPETLGGIQLGSDEHYCAIPDLERVHVWDATRILPQAGFGISLHQVQNASIHNCWLYRNRYNLYRPNAGYATSTKVSGKSGYIGGGYAGVVVDGFFDDLYLDDVVVEGNLNWALAVTANAVRDDRGSNIYVNGAYMELNGEVGNGAISIQGGPGPYQHHVIVVERVYFAAGALPFLALDRANATVRNCRLTPSQVRTTSDCTVRFDSNKHPTGSNFVTGYRALLGNIMVTDMVDPNLATDLNQLNLLSSVTFPEQHRPVADRRSLDDYNKALTGQWVPVGSFITGSGVTITGKFVKVGSIVHVQYNITGTDMSFVWTGSNLSVPFQPLQSTPCTVLNASTGTTPGNGYVDAGSGVLFLPAMATTTGVIVVSATYLAA